MTAHDAAAASSSAIGKATIKEIASVLNGRTSRAADNAMMALCR
ncbi:hypothetical protein [Bradyrhizobium iriomotense]|nr:hypothetical protein [Bradyrhizobium iriomotense]